MKIEKRALRFVSLPCQFKYKFTYIRVYKKIIYVASVNDGISPCMNITAKFNKVTKMNIAREMNAKIYLK